MRLTPTLAIVFVVSSVAGAPLASADVITVALPQLVGVYAPGHRTFAFDLGTEFQSISAVSIRMAGRGTPGLQRGDGVERPVDPPFPLLASLGAILDPDPGLGLWAASTRLLDGPFELNQRFAPVTTPQSWAFLLGGRGNITIEFLPAITIGGGQVIRPPLGEVAEASLSVEGTVVPEPTTLVLLAVAMAALPLRRRMRAPRQSGRWA